MIAHSHTDETQIGSCSRKVNVGSAERLISAAVGGALFAHGLSRRTLKGLLLSAIGGACVYRGFTGHCDVYDKLNVSTLEPNAQNYPRGNLNRDEAEAIEEDLGLPEQPEVQVMESEPTSAAKKSRGRARGNARHN